MDDLGLAEPVDGLGERVVMAVAHAANRGLDTNFRQMPGVAKRHQLASTIAMVNQAATMQRARLMRRLFQRTRHKARMRGA